MEVFLLSNFWTNIALFCLKTARQTADSTIMVKSGASAAALRGAEKARAGKLGSGAYSSGRGAKAIPKWNVTSEYVPPRKISDKELEVARKMFFDLDRDGSGSIDAEELGMMLRSLGQNPTEEELNELIDSVDEGDKDGQIQLREFLKLYTQGLDAKRAGKAGKDDVVNVFCALGGDPHNKDSLLNKEHVKEYLMEHYMLDVDVDMFAKGDSVSRADLESFLLEAKA